MDKEVVESKGHGFFLLLSERGWEGEAKNTWLEGELTDLPPTTASDSGVFPYTSTSELIEDQAIRTLADDIDAIGALVIIPTVGGVLVLEVTILARALDSRGLGSLCGNG